MKVPANNLLRHYQEHQQEYENKALEILRSGNYVLGNEVDRFEKDFAKYIGTNYCVGLGNCLDALWLSFRVLGIGAGDKTKAILVVHLYGTSCEIDKIVAIARKHNLRLVEDCAQSHGATYQGQMTGSFGDIGCFSFYPSKNLGAFGDGGAITTNSPELDQAFRMYRFYGSEKRYYNKVVGTNSRLDELQAGLLNVKLRYLDALNADRNRVCTAYLNKMNNPVIALPKLRDHATTVWHQFVITTPYRDELKDYLEAAGIGSIIHYPIPPHLSEAYAYLNIGRGSLPITEKLADQVLSLPLFYGMTDTEIDTVVAAINAFVPRLLES
jgi:dTDP-4-amino-4,6-dideoxygalactose transaminase